MDDPAHGSAAMNSGVFAIERTDIAQPATVLQAEFKQRVRSSRLIGRQTQGRQIRGQLAERPVRGSIAAC